MFVFVQNILFSQAYTVLYEKTQKPDLDGQLDQIKDIALRRQLESRIIITPFELQHKDGTSNFSDVKEESGNKNNTDDPLKLENNHTNINVIKVGDNSSSAISYKDISNKIYLKSANLMGKDFLIKDTLSFYDWQLSNETRIIGDYVCKKAISLHDNQEITAWYAPSIPINDGPDEYYGLPGLIMELSIGNTVFNALSIKETPDISIKKPSGGKEITKKEYEKMRNERMEALRQQYSNN